MLTRMRLENFKSWKNTGDIALKPITGFFGANSSGKTSLIQALLLLKQTADSPDRGIVFHFGDRRTPVDLGDFESVVYEHDTRRTLRVSLDWQIKRPMTVRDLGSTDSGFRSDRIGFDVALRAERNPARTSPVPGDVDPCFCRLRRFLVVLAQSSVPTQPCERPLDNPTTRKYLKGVLTGWTPYQFQVPSTHVPDPWYQLACVGPVSPYPPQPREPTGQAYERQPSPVSILNVCRMHHHCQQQPRSVYDDVSLSSTDVLTSIIATRPPFSVVLTDWLSMMAALGLTARPSARRNWSRRTS